MTDENNKQGLSSRMSQLERHLSVDTRRKKSLFHQIKDDFDETECKLDEIHERIVDDIKKEFCIEHRNLLVITRTLMYYINKYAHDIALLISVPVNGSFKFKYVITILSDLFTDLSIDLLGVVIENIYQTDVKLNKKGVEIQHSDAIEKAVNKKKGKFFFNARRRISSSLHLRIGNP